MFSVTKIFVPAVAPLASLAVLASCGTATAVKQPSGLHATAATAPSSDAVTLTDATPASDAAPTATRAAATTQPSPAHSPRAMGMEPRMRMGGTGMGGMGMGGMSCMGGMGMGGMGMNGMGMGGGMGMRRDGPTIHSLLADHEKVKRTVEEIPDGIRSITTSGDPQVAALVRKHVWQMKDRLERGEPIRMMDPLFREVFAHHDKIRLAIEDVPGGVRVTETSDDPQVVLLIRQHAKTVNEFVADGMRRMHQPTPLPEGYAR